MVFVFWGIYTKIEKKNTFLRKTVKYNDLSFTIMTFLTESLFIIIIIIIPCVEVKNHERGMNL